LSRNACEYVVQFTDSNPKIESFFRDTFAPEETFIHTILGNSPLRERVRGNVLFEDWTDGSSIGSSPSGSKTEEIGSRSNFLAFLTSSRLAVARLKGGKTYGANCLFPQILTDQHVASFEAQEKVLLDDVYGRREALFARRFSDDTLDVVNRLDGMIMRKEESNRCP